MALDPSVLAQGSARVNVAVNGRPYTVSVPFGRTLVDLLRRDLWLTGTKESCGTGDCGSCTVLLDGRAIKACIVLAHEADGAEIVTVEGLAAEELDPLQRAFAEKWGTQCGYCTPGFIMAAKALLDQTPRPTDDEIKHAIAGNLCRCTGYVKIIEAIRAAAEAQATEPSL